MKIISTIVCDRHGWYLVLPLFSGWLNGQIIRQIDFSTDSGFTRTSVWYLLQFTRKLQISSDFEKWETSLDVTQWIIVTLKSIQRKYFFYKQAAWAQSCLKPFRRFHEMTVFWWKLHDYETYFQKDDCGIFQFTVLQINQDFPVHKLFPQLWRYPYETCDTHLKTGNRLTNQLNNWGMYNYIG